MFREIFDFEENDRNRKDLKRDYKALEADHKTVKFKHLIGTKIFVTYFYLDFYLTSSEDFGHALKAVDSRKVLESLNMQENSSNEEESGESQDNQISSFNEKLVRVICLNQAIDKYQREIEIIKSERDHAVD
jgi:hypothetical protein